MSDWTPATGAERTMFAAADREALLAALVSAPLLMPVSPAAADGLEPPAWATGVHDGVTYVLMFTSEEAIAACLPGRSVRYRTDSVPDVVAAWPDPSWRLAVDLGLPIGLTLDAAELQALPDLAVEGEDQLRAAVAAKDPDLLTAAMLRSEMIVPVRPDGSESRDLSDPEFPWWTVTDQTGAPGVAVFTSEQRLHQALGDQDFVAVSSLHLAGDWPDPSWQLSLNPATPLAVQMPGPAVVELAAFLGRVRTTMVEERRREHAEKLAAEEAALRPRPVLATSPALPRKDVYEPDPAAPVRLQLVIPPMYLSAYLERHYDRAAGLVHRWYGPGRETPRRLYERLDLTGPGSPFDADDDWVAVLRWAPDDQTPAEWAEGEPRMETIVVRTGTELHRVTPDGGDVLVAVYDATARRWTPPPG